MKIGMVGLDTSHAVEFLKLFHNPRLPFHVPGLDLVKAFPGGNPAFSLSRDRVEKLTSEVSDAGVEIVSSMEALSVLDAYLLESVDGSQHLEQFRILAEFGKPVFIDKPLACSFSEANAMVELAKEKSIPLMSASGIRFARGVGDLLPQGETVHCAEGFGPMGILPDYRDYFWYGIHTAETVYRYLGQGCSRVQALSLGDFDTLIGTWADGRQGICSGNRRGANCFGARILTDTTQHIGIINPEIPYLYPLATAIAHFFQTGVPSVDPAESLEVIAFLEAASRSKQAGGKPVALADL